MQLLRRLIFLCFIVSLISSRSSLAYDINEPPPIKVRLLNDIGGHFYDSGQYLDAKAYFTLAIKLYPNYVDALVNRSAVYNALGKFQEAVNDGTRALRLQPNNVQALNNRANAYAGLGKYSQALNDYKNSYRLDPKFLDVVFNIANLYYRLNLRLDAVRYYTRAIEIHPGLIQAYIFRGVALHELGYQKRSNADLDAVMKMQARSPQISLLLSQALVQVKRFKDAEKVLTQLLLEKESAEALATRAEALYYLKNYPAALTDIERAISIKNNIAYQALRMKINKKMPKK